MTTTDAPSGGAPSGGARTPRSLLGKLFDFLASYGFAVILLLLLMLLTFVGTLEQRNTSLFEVQQKYFESYWVRHEMFGIDFLLPGVYLLLLLLSVNLIAGGFIRIRKSKSTVGILIVHAGIVTMLMGSLIEFHVANKGHMTLFEGAQAAEFKSYNEWEITVRKAGSGEALVIPGDRFVSLDPDAAAAFYGADMPFEMVVGTVFKNAQVLPDGARKPHEPPAVDGYFVRELEGRKDAENDAAALYVTAVEKDGTKHEGILWAHDAAPWSVVVDDQIWYASLQRRRFPLPFTIRLDEFRRELHARTMMAAAFESDVTKFEGATEQKINISMNEPLRHAGFIFFQSGWGPQDARPGQPLFSTFSVVENPADQVPLVACIIMTVGLLVHFVGKLVGHVRRERRKA